MRRVILVLSVVGLLLWVVGPAAAIVNGEYDGDRHPMVGAMYFDFNEDGQLTWEDSFCSGSYAGWSKDGSSQIFLTAAHCLAWAPETISVSFDPDPMEGDGVPDGLIQATDFSWDPRYGKGFWGQPYDSGVVLLPAGSVTGISPVELPPLGYLDESRHMGTLQHSLIELAGYGTVPTWHQPGGTQFSYDTVRRTGVAEVTGLLRFFVRFQQNVQATGMGGVCYGDSGSPNLVPGTRIVVSTTTGVGGIGCNAFGLGYRLDTSEAREFLGDYLELP